MKRSVSLVIGSAVTGVVALLGAAPAHAQSVDIHDPAGDASGQVLDITRVHIDNGDHAIVTKVRMVATVRGHLIVSMDPRGGHGVRVLSKHGPAGQTHSRVVSGAFTDRGGSSGPVACPGLRVRWNAERPVVRLRLPSTCLAGGDYGAVRFAVLTEVPRGGDGDWAPGYTSTAWIPRG